MGRTGEQVTHVQGLPMYKDSSIVKDLLYAVNTLCEVTSNPDPGNTHQFQPPNP